MSDPTFKVEVNFSRDDADSEDPYKLVETRVIRELRLRYGLDDDEIYYIETGDRFQESIHDQVSTAIVAFDGGFLRKPKDTVVIKVLIDRPGTRNRSLASLEN